MTLRPLPIALLVVSALLAPASAMASSSQESTFQDDNHLLYSSRAEVEATLDTLSQLGVDRLRITLLWKAVAPQPGSRTRPASFDATDPRAYPPGAWDRFDTVVLEAQERGMDVNFNVTAPGPLWAMRPSPRDDIAETFEPAPREFAAFVVAAGRRYSGEFPPSPYVLPQHKLPRVSYWSIWNEPNHSGWLTPTWSADSPRAVERAASLYRELADAAYSALAVTGHHKDTILIGETAPKGDRSRGVKRYMQPLTFLRALYCVDRNARHLTGSRAAALGCPADPGKFRAEHPVLFEATGYAHHPYELILPPSFPPLRPDDVTISGLSRLTKLLDRIHRRHGSRRRVPIYLTEYGYQTNPPDQLGVTFRRQAAYLNQSEYMAFRNRRVRTLAQFLLYDDDIKIPASFQSGLLTQSGTRKPSFAAYRLPIWLPRAHIRRAGAVRVWALLRPAPNGARATADIQFRPRGSKRWRRVKRATTRNARNYLQTTVRVRRSGHLRVQYRPPSGPRATSRAASIRVG